jgi:hypothetical protein
MDVVEAPGYEAALVACDVGALAAGGAGIGLRVSRQKNPPATIR